MVIHTDHEGELHGKEKSGELVSADRKRGQRKAATSRTLFDIFRARQNVKNNQQTRVYPYPSGAGSARPNPKMGVLDPENP